jgi:hypothetical protein
MNYLEIRIKMKRVIDSCTTVHQLMNGKRYCEMLIDTYDNISGRMSLSYTLESLAQNKEYP